MNFMYYIYIFPFSILLIKGNKRVIFKSTNKISIIVYTL